MAAIPLLTSLPPALKRHDERKVDIGAQYQLRCIESWRQSGFHPISLNALGEKLPTGLAAQVTVETQRIDATASTGRPLIYLSSFLARAQQVSKSPVAITNADIILELAPEERRAVQELSPGEFLMAHRTDVDNPWSRSRQRRFVEGYDFFVVHPEDLSRLRWVREQSYVFGMPWWDYFLPVALVASGVKARRLDSSGIIHLRHLNRWDPNAGRRFGEEFLNDMLDLRAQMESGKVGNEEVTSFLHALEHPAPPSPLATVKAIIRRHLKGDQETERRHILAGAAGTTRKFISQSLASTQV